MIDFTVKPDNGDEFEVTADSRDIYVWEKTNRKGRTFKTLMDDLAFVDLYAIAHQASRRTGKYEGTLAEFTDECALDFDLDDEDAEPDPTRPAA